jgi:hypothetical protein
MRFRIIACRDDAPINVMSVMVGGARQAETANALHP